MNTGILQISIHNAAGELHAHHDVCAGVAAMHLISQLRPACRGTGDFSTLVVSPLNLGDGCGHFIT